jgi:hypothetical protein
MLLKMTDKLDVQLDGHSIDIEHLDITSYLSAPNRINTCNKHVGMVYHIFPDFSNMSWLGGKAYCVVKLGNAQYAENRGVLYPKRRARI